MNEKRTSKGDFDIEINSISLEEFIYSWAEGASFSIKKGLPSKRDFRDLVSELNDFGIKTVLELMEIIPENYVEKANEINYSTNVYGLVRDWMLLHDYKRYHKDVNYNWVILEPENEMNLLSELLSTKQLSELLDMFRDSDVLDDYLEAEC